MKEALKGPVAKVLAQMKEMKLAVATTTIGEYPIRQTAIRAFKVNLLSKLTHLIQHHRLECTQGYLEEIDAATLDFMASVLSLTEEEAAMRAHQLRLPNQNQGGFGLVSMKSFSASERSSALWSVWKRH